MKYDNEFLNKIVQVGTLGYPLSKILNVLDIEDEEQFVNDFDDPKSNVAKSYQKGIDKSDFILDSKLFEMAKNGDLKALSKFEAREKNNICKRERESR